MLVISLTLPIVLLISLYIPNNIKYALLKIDKTNFLDFKNYYIYKIDRKDSFNFTKLKKYKNQKIT